MKVKNKKDDVNEVENGIDFEAAVEEVNGDIEQIQEYDIALGKRTLPPIDYSEHETSPLKAIRKHCLECCCGQIIEVKYCQCVNCPLHPFRFGHSPFNKKGRTVTLTDEQKKKLVEGKKAKKNKEN